MILRKIEEIRNHYGFSKATFWLFVAALVLIFTPFIVGLIAEIMKMQK